jgi:hypothetical protein
MLAHRTSCYNPAVGSLRTVGAVSANLQPRHDDAEAAIFLDLAFQILENIAHEFHDLATAQASHVDVIAIQLALIIMPLSVDMHQIEFVNQSVALEQFQRAVDRAAVDAGVQFLRLAQKLSRIQMFGGRLHHAQNGSALLGHADSALGEVRLKAARNFCLR